MSKSKSFGGVPLIMSWYTEPFPQPPAQASAERTTVGAASTSTPSDLRPPQREPEERKDEILQPQQQPALLTPTADQRRPDERAEERRQRQHHLIPTANEREQQGALSQTLKNSTDSPRGAHEASARAITDIVTSSGVSRHTSAVSYASPAALDHSHPKANDALDEAAGSGLRSEQRHSEDDAAEGKGDDEGAWGGLSLYRRPRHWV